MNNLNEIEIRLRRMSDQLSSALDGVTLPFKRKIRIQELRDQIDEISSDMRILDDTMSIELGRLRIDTARLESENRILRQNIADRKHIEDNWKEHITKIDSSLHKILSKYD